MKKVIIVLFFFCSVQMLNAATCTNPLQSLFNFIGPISAEIVPGITVCKSLQNKETCCSIDIFNSIQQRAEDLAAMLRQDVASRDISLTDIRLKILPGLEGSIQRIVAAVQKLSSGGGPVDFNALLAKAGVTNIGGMIMNLESSEGLSNSLNNIQQLNQKIPGLKNDYVDYQKARTRCVIQMIKLQAATWCLACDPDYANKGVGNDGSIALSQTIKDKLVNACYDYFSGAQEQSMLLDLQQMSSLVNDIAGAVEDLSNGNQQGITKLAMVAQKFLALPPPTDNAQKPAAVPETCTQKDCPFIWNQVYNKGQVNPAMLAHGGIVGASASRLLEEDSQGRILQKSSWDPEDDEAGIAVSFEDDPGNTNGSTASSTLFGTTFVSIATLLLALVY